MLHRGDVYENWGRTQRVRLVDWEDDFVVVAYLYAPGGWGRMSKGRFATEFSHVIEVGEKSPSPVKKATLSTYKTSAWVDELGRTIVERRKETNNG